MSKPRAIASASFTMALGTLSEDELLHALLRLAIEHMTDAIRRISIGEGYDPADHALLAFGGAGPQHACAVAESLGIRTILVPQHAGILSAVGLQEAIPERDGGKGIPHEAFADFVGRFPTR
jgi:5-oxoprolinase (ATP-hydrolysing)